MSEQNQLVLVIASVVLEKDGKYLLVQERKKIAYGLWNLPGGRVDERESLKQAAAREAREEVGFDIAVGDEILLLHPTADSPVLHAYSATITGGELNFPETEILDAQWFSLDEVASLQLRNPELIIGAIEAAAKI